MFDNENEFDDEPKTKTEAYRTIDDVAAEWRERQETRDDA